jgi:hypothetical protein
VVLGVVIPGLVYLGSFSWYTWPWLIHFDSEFWTDTGDGYQNVWNMWWVNRSVTKLHQLPWHTTALHYPYGTSLLGQTMNPFNGLVGIVLLHFLTLVEAFNVMIVFSYVGTGLTAFWLCRYVCRRYIPSLVGGFIVTFSSYHMAKTMGLMQLVSLEWVPLFILLWWRLLTRPRVSLGVGSAVTLLLVLLCDYYYFLFCVLAAVAILVHLWRQHELKFDRKSVAVFGSFGVVLVAPLPVALVVSNLNDAMVGGHASQSTDLLSLVIDGGHWHFSQLTHWYYGANRTGLAESTLYLSATVTVLVGVAVAVRNRLGPHAKFWLVFAAIPAVFCLGPQLVIGGRDTGVPLPFALLKDAIPPLQYNLEPGRIIVMSTVAAGVLAALVLSRLDLNRTPSRLVMGVVCAGLALELWPGSPPVAPIARPAYVTALQRLPSGGVIDDAAVANGVVDKSLQLYDQVLDGQSLAFGYISRTPTSVSNDDARLSAVIAAHDYSRLCHQYQFRYLSTPASQPLTGSLPVLYHDTQAIIYMLC